MLLQAQIDSDVSSRVSSDTELLFGAGLMLPMVFGDEGVDLSQAAGLVPMLSSPGLPFGQLYVQALSALADEFENGFGAGLGSCGAVEPFLGPLPVSTPGEAPVAAELFEGFLGGYALLTRPTHFPHRCPGGAAPQVQVRQVHCSA